MDINHVNNPSASDRRMVRNYMLLPDVYEYHIDGSCNVLNMTTIAEDAADEYGIYEDEIDYNIPEWVFEIAYEVDTILVKKGICQL